MNYFDKQNLKQIGSYLGQEMAIVLFIFVFGAGIGFGEVDSVISEGIGHTIASFGVLWGIGAFFRMNTWTPLFLSIGSALGLFLLGTGLHEYGLFPALMLVSGYVLFVSLFLLDCFGIDLSNSYRKKAIVYSFLLLMIFGIF